MRVALAANVVLAEGELADLLDGRRTTDANVVLAEGVGAVRETKCEVLMMRGDRAGNGWVGTDWALVVVPETDGRWRVHVTPTEFFPDLLARLNDVGPRPRPADEGRMRLPAGQLAELLARRSLPEAHSMQRPAEDSSALNELVTALREHWRLEARWEPSDGSPGMRVIEVLDTDAGLWLVVPSDPHVELWPTSPTDVWKQLCGLLPSDAELAP